MAYRNVANGVGQSDCKNLSSVEGSMCCNAHVFGFVSWFGEPGAISKNQAHGSTGELLSR